MECFHGISFVTGPISQGELLYFSNIPIYLHVVSRKNTYMNFKKHVRLFGETRTCFNVNTHMFSRH